MTRYTIHGLVTDSEVALRASIADRALATDITVRSVPKIAFPEPDPATLLYRSDWEGQPWQQVFRVNDCVIVKFAGVGVFRINSKNNAIDYVWLSNDPDHLGPILLEGYMFALLLTLRGKCVLHASGVKLVDGRALVMVGQSGAGKSTMATLLAAGGRPHIADDVIGVDLSKPGSAIVASGSRSIRLREKAWELQSLFTGVNSSMSVDDRLVLEDTSLVGSEHELAAIWIPYPDPNIRELRIEPVNSIAAIKHVIANLRIELSDPAYRRKSFNDVIDLTQRVPTSIVHVPWGPPWLPETIDALAAAAGDLCR
jgi:hypothetical protein